MSDEVQIFFSTSQSYKFVSLIFAANNVTQHMYVIMQIVVEASWECSAERPDGNVRSVLYEDHYLELARFQ